MPLRAVERGLARGHREVEEEVVVATRGSRAPAPAVAASTDRTSDGASGPRQQRGRRDIAVVALVAHLEGLRDEAAQVDRATLAQRRGQGRARAWSPSSAAGSSTVSSYAPKRSTLPSPSLSVAKAARPAAVSSTTTTGMDGLTTPAMGPTAPWWWHGASSTTPRSTDRRPRRASPPSPRTAMAPMTAPRTGPHIRSQADRRTRRGAGVRGPSPGASAAPAGHRRASAARR